MKVSFSPLDSRVIVIFRDMGMILIEIPIIFHYEFAIKLRTHRLEMCTQGL